VGSLPQTFREVVSLLQKEKYNYLVIGGIASGILGNPRMTQDVDISLCIKSSEVKDFLKKTKGYGFDVEEKEMLQRARETGTFKILKSGFHIDFIIPSTKFEREALKRKQRLKVYGIDAWFPTPEDLILFKIVPARHIDMADIEGIIARYPEGLDKNYLMNWAQRLSDEAQDMRIYNTLKKLLKI
jgi:hypothetical protein